VFAGLGASVYCRSGLLGLSYNGHMRRLMTLWIISFLLARFPMTASAQTPGSTKAQPQAEWSLAEAPMKRLLKERIVAELNKAADKDGPPVTGAARVKFVRLNASGRTGIEVRAPNEWCGATGNCEVWIFDSKTSNLLAKGDGWDYVFHRATHRGLFDFSVRLNMSAFSGTITEYQFDGNVYQEVDSKEETY
jgi:hypothetical protein